MSGIFNSGEMDADDPRSQLVWSFMKAVEISRPDAFVMENVKALASLEKFKFIREGLVKKAIQLGYEIDLVVLNSKDFGVPQSRERMFLVGFKNHKNNLQNYELPSFAEVILLNIYFPHHLPPFLFCYHIYLYQRY